jgi:hypothetical protein
MISMAGGALARATLLALVVMGGAMAGCTQDGSDAGSKDADTDEEQTEGTCQATSTTGKTGNTGAQLQCRGVSGADAQRETFPCRTPSDSGVRLGTDLAAGNLTVTVRDADNITVFEQTFDQASNRSYEIPINEGTAGIWYVEAERDAAFEGSFGLQVVCSGEN